jgi:hypothetical protein
MRATYKTKHVEIGNRIASFQDLPNGFVRIVVQDATFANNIRVAEDRIAPTAEATKVFEYLAALCDAKVILDDCMSWIPGRRTDPSLFNGYRADAPIS